MQKSIKEYCELCGSPLYGRGITVFYEGSIITVCNSCYQRIKKYAKIVSDKESSRRSTFSSQTITSAQPQQKSNPRQFLETDYEIVDDYANIIKNGRERLALSQKQLAEKLKVSENIIKRFESGKLKPTIDQAKQLERILGVKILVKIEESETPMSKNKKNELTLGDIVNIREGKK